MTVRTHTIDGGLDDHWCDLPNHGSSSIRVISPAQALGEASRLGPKRERAIGTHTYGSLNLVAQRLVQARNENFDMRVGSVFGLDHAEDFWSLVLTHAVTLAELEVCDDLHAAPSSST